MKRLSFLLLLYTYSFLSAQTAVIDDEKYIVFNLKHEVDKDAPKGGIHPKSGIRWDKEKPASEFVLNGAKPLKYSIRLKNDTLAMLYRHEGKKQVFEDTIVMDSYELPYWKIRDKELRSEWRITDLDKDGNEDLICRVWIDITDAEFMIIYLNDPIRKKLVKLKDTTDDSYIWVSPSYNKETKLITAEHFAEFYGFMFAYAYRLENHVAIPIYKEVRDHEQELRYIHKKDTEDIVSHLGHNAKEFIGGNGKWKLVPPKIDKSISVVSVGKTNVLYSDIENPVNIAVPGARSVSVTSGDASASAVRIDNNGTYQILPVSGGEIKLNIVAEMQDGSVVREEKVFTVIDELPLPEVAINGETICSQCVLEMTAEELVGAKLTVVLPDGVPFEKTEVRSFRISIWADDMPAIKVNGPVIDDDDDAKALKGRLKPGSDIFISNVSCYIKGSSTVRTVLHPKHVISIRIVD